VPRYLGYEQVGFANTTVDVVRSTGERYTDTKFLTGVWSSNEQYAKMIDGEWITNEDAGLMISGHRWYEPPPELTFEVLVAAGGGGGGFRDAGGGGAGGLITWTEITASPSTAFPVTIGSGGGGSPNTSNRGTSGGNSILVAPQCQLF